MNQAVDSELAGAPGVRGCMRYSRMGAPNRQIHPTSNRRKRTPGGLHQSSSDRWHLVCTLHGSGLFQLKKNQKRARHRCRTTPSSTPDTVAIRTPSVCGHPTCRSIVSRAGHQNRTSPPRTTVAVPLRAFVPPGVVSPGLAEDASEPAIVGPGVGNGHCREKDRTHDRQDSG